MNSASEEKIKLIETLRIAEAYKGLRDHIYFCKEILGFNEVEESVHRPVVNFIENKVKPFKLVLLPRGSFKTSLITIGYAVKDIIKNPNIRILIDASKYDPDCLKYIQSVRNILSNNEKLKWLYGDIFQEGDRWKDTEITVKRPAVNLKEPTLMGGSIEVSMVRFHFDKIYCDDLVNDQNTQTKEQIEKVIDHFKGLFNILEPNGEMIMLGTRWHYNDLYGHILDNLKGEFDIMHRKAIEDDGTLFFPQRLSKKYLDQRRAIEGDYMFSCQYQNTPVNPQDQLFKSIPTYATLSEVPKELFLSMTVDPAVSMDKKADDTAFNICGTTMREDIFVIEDLAGKFNPEEVIDSIFHLHKKWGLHAIGIEEVAFQKVLKFFLQREELRRGIRLPIVELKTDNTKSKFMRIQSLQPFFSRKQIFVRQNMTQLLDQLKMYPKVRHDDRVDALAYQLQLYKKPFSTAPIEDEQAKIDERRLKGLTAPAVKKKRQDYEE